MKMRQFLVYPYPEEVGLAPSLAAGVIRDEENEKIGPNGGGGVYYGGDREGKMEIPAKRNIFAAYNLLSGCCESYSDVNPGVPPHWGSAPLGRGWKSWLIPNRGKRS